MLAKVYNHILLQVNGCLLWNQKIQTCVNCKPASDCTTVTAARLTSTADECKYWCSMGRSTCEIAYQPYYNCMMFAKYHCNSVVEEAGEKVFRLTCASGNITVICIKQNTDISSVQGLG